MNPVWTNEVARLWFNVMRIARREVGSTWCSLIEGRIECGWDISVLLEHYRSPRSWL